MMGKSHLLVGTVVAASGVVVLKALGDGSSAAAITSNNTVSAWLHAWPQALGGIDPQASPGWSTSPLSVGAEVASSWLGIPETMLSVWGIAFAVIAAALVWLGSLLPDIDSKNSLLGRHVPFPGPHHGFMHTDWFLAVLFMASLSEPTRLLFWLWLGAALHCWMDGLSQAGRVRFYPLARYKIISLPGGSGACVAPAGNHTALYRVGQLSEVVVLAAAAGLSVAAAWVLLGP
jgi:hypothetical protein